MSDVHLSKTEPEHWITEFKFCYHLQPCNSCTTVKQWTPWLHPHSLLWEGGAVREVAKDYAVAARFAVKTAEKNTPKDLQSEFSSAKWFSPPYEGWFS